MKTIHYTYKFRLQPTKNQQILLNKHFGCTRLVYNVALELKQQLYNDYGVSINKNELFEQLKDTKEDIRFLKEINSQSLQQAIHNLDDAFKNFFEGRAKYPKFKSKNRKNSFRVPQGIRIDNDKISINKFREGIKFIKHREIDGNVKQATISREPSGKYYISILVEKECKPKEKVGKITGIDLGIKDLAITSDGKRFKNHKYLKKYEKKLKYLQKQKDRKKRGSWEYENQRKQLARLHEKIRNCRNDNLHKISRQLVDENDVIILEDLAVKNMMGNHKLAKSIGDVAWGNFIRMIGYKLEWDNKEMIKIDRFFPSSKLCSNCGWKNENLSLSDRTWVCGGCGTEHDRDKNASKNIENEGLRMLSGCGTHSDVKQKREEALPLGESTIPETHQL